MARRRKAPAGRGSQEGRVLTSEEVGSDNPEVTSVTMAVSGEYPEEYEDFPDSWKRAYDACAKHGNPIKACVNWAEDHYADYDESIEGDERDVRIAELERQLAEAQGNGS